MAATKKKVVTKKRRMKLSDFLFKGELGRGTYGSVFKALRKGKTKPYAIKVINMNSHAHIDIVIFCPEDEVFIKQGLSAT